MPHRQDGDGCGVLDLEEGHVPAVVERYQQLAQEWARPGLAPRPETSCCSGIARAGYRIQLLHCPAPRSMFGSSKPVVLSYGARRPRARPPRWLMLLLAGVAIGAAGLWVIQERYLAPRLSADATARLRTDFEQADAERQRLKSELAATSQRLQTALAQGKALGDEAATSRRTVAHLREDVAALAAALPPDPRGGAVQVRAARLTSEGGRLMYDVVLSRDRGGNKPLAGVLQFVVAGGGRGPERSVKLEPIAVSLGTVESLRGGVPLPEGFAPRKATVHVLDRPDGKLLGMRVINVQ